ncbi:Minor extracellular protease vpr, partial [Colletotrichum shisoi]
MRIHPRALAVEAVLTTPALAATRPGTVVKASPAPSVGFIIELESNESVNGRGLDEDAHSAFHRRAEDLLDYSVRHQFKNPEYFYGLSIHASNDANVDALLALPQVKRVWPNRYYNRPIPVGSGRPVECRTPLNRLNLRMTGADQAHALGLTGKGIKVGFLDTGVDWRHPALGGGFGEGFKVAGGYDLVGDDFEGWNDPVPDDDPLTTCLDGGHGTHVAGSLNPPSQRRAGSALLTQFSYYSLSIGETAIWETGSPYTTLLAKIQSQGIGIIIAAGNEGDLHFATACNAAGSDGLAIEYGRVLSPSKHFNVFVADDENGERVDKAWTKAIADFIDMESVVALVTASSNCFYEIVDEGSSSGIKNVWSWFHNADDMSIDQPSSYGDIDTVKERKTEADKILAGIADQSNNFTLSFEDQTVHQIDQPTGGTTSWFSTFGPAIEMSLKPQVSAPGGTILSTWVTSNGWGYAVTSRTSMAIPHLAGCYALLKQKFPNLSPQEIARRLQSSAEPLKQYNGDDILTTTAQQGSGLVNIPRAITSDTVFLATEFNLRDIAGPVERNFTIENQSSAPKTYTLGHKPAAEVDALLVSFSAESITVPVGGRATVKFTVTPPVVDPALLPTYSGFIAVADGEDNFLIPYLGT